MKFETINGKLCRMVEPTPLTPDSQFPCVVRLIQDDSPMGLYHKDLFRMDKDEYGPKICDEVRDIKDLSDSNRGSVIHSGGTVSAQYYHFEIIGYPVVDGSAEWALYQMMQGKDIIHGAAKSFRRLDTFSETEIRVSDAEGEVVQIVSFDKFLAEASPDGWQLYEPQPAKEPIANCDNCKHICTNSNIDHCHMYEPQPAYAVGDWVTDGVVTGCVSELCGSECLWIDATDEASYHINITNARKLKPSEVVVHIGCLSGTVEDISYADNGRFWLFGPKTERCPWGQCAILYADMLDAQTRSLVGSLLKAQEEE